MKQSKKVLLLLSIIVLSFNSYSQKNKVSGTNYVFKSFNDTASYILGADIGQNLINNYIQINSELFMKGLNDAYASIDTIFKKADIEKIMQRFQLAQQKIVEAEKGKEVSIHKKAGNEFLEKNKALPGVKETSSGLQYKVLKEGNGEHPIASSKVTVHYEGRLIDGKVFDSSYERNETATFPLSGVIKGWTEGLQLMAPGSYYEFYIPSDLAYGDGGTRGIPGGALLIFKVELISFE